jgi:hypothetical protein
MSVADAGSDVSSDLHAGAKRRRRVSPFGNRNAAPPRIRRAVGIRGGTALGSLQSSPFFAPFCPGVKVIRTIRRGTARLATLPSVRRRELTRAVIVLAFARLALWLLPFRTLRSLMSRLGRATSSRKAATENAAVDHIARAVGVAARFIPAATCLVQAMATQFLLGRRGVESTLRLGVTRAAAGKFQAHAWVECRDRVVVGGKDSPSVYSVLPAMAAWRRCGAMAG